MLSELLEDDHEHLLDLLGRALTALGPAHGTTLVEPTRAFFPDPYEPTVVCAGQLLHRLLSWAGLGDHELVVEDARAPLDELPDEELAVTQPTVFFVAVENRQVTFQIERLGPGDV